MRIAPHEFVADLPLCTDAETLCLALVSTNVIPELWLRKENQSLVCLIWAIAIPQVGKAREGAEAIGKGDAPHWGDLEAGMSIIELRLEVLLVEHLECEGLAEVCTVPLESRTNEGS